LEADDAKSASCTDAVFGQYAQPECGYHVEDCYDYILANDFGADFSACEGLGNFNSQTPSFLDFISAHCVPDPDQTPAPTMAPVAVMEVGESAAIPSDRQVVYCTAMKDVYVSQGGSLLDAICNYVEPAAERRLLQAEYKMVLTADAKSVQRNLAAFADTAAISALVTEAVKTAATAAGVTVDMDTLVVFTPAQETPEPTAEPTNLPTPAPPTPAPEPTAVVPTVAPPTVFYSGSSVVGPSVVALICFALGFAQLF
jgi:hypothetical protein